MGDSAEQDFYALARYCQEKFFDFNVPSWGSYAPRSSPVDLAIASFPLWHYSKEFDEGSLAAPDYHRVLGMRVQA
jgi:hypothetical protein